MLRLFVTTRFGSQCPMYFDICQNDSQTYKEVSAELLALLADKGWHGDTEHMCATVSLYWKKEEYWAKSVAFATMCLEAFIYDHAAQNLSDTYVKNYLDKLDLISKWVVIPKLAIGKDFPRDSKAFEYLGKLVKFRNKLVHAKSIPWPNFDDDPNDAAKQIGPMIRKDVERDKYMADLSPYKMILEIFTVLRKLEGDDIATQWWKLEEREGDYPWK